jgi:hypothetical protein
MYTPSEKMIGPFSPPAGGELYEVLNKLKNPARHLIGQDFILSVLF